MADITLYDEPVTYPITEAVANGKLKFEKSNSMTVEIPTAVVNVVGTRSSTSNPWEIQVTKSFGYKTQLEFGKQAVECSDATLGWKSMADLVLKEHNRPSGDETWALKSIGRPGVSFTSGPFYVKDATNPIGYKNAVLSEITAAVSLRVDETGDASFNYSGVNGGAILMARSVVTDALTKAIGSILADTTSTSKSYELLMVDVPSDAKVFGAFITTKYKLVEASGTEAISLGNYSLGSRVVRIETIQSGVQSGYHERSLKRNEVLNVPSITMDSLRKAAKALGTAAISVIASEKDDAITVDDRFSVYPIDGVGNATLAHVCIADPNGYLEVDFDQSNSLNVLATAAFAGLGGLASVGAATELERLLANSSLAPLFANAATVLGSTTAAVITGYVASLIAAYTQGWITNSQLFKLSNHVAWIKGGLATIVAAGTAGVAITEAGSLLGYLGVGGNALQMAMNALGGAATSAGIALGMAAVMGKSVKHTYWGV